MSEQGYIIQPPPIPWWKRLSLDRILGIVALLVALSAAIFSALQYRAANRQADIAEQARRDARRASDDQARDVERSRTAAEKSAAAAEKLAAGMERSAKAAESSANAGRDALGLNKRALILSNQPNVVVFNSRLSQPLTVGTAPEVNTQIANLGKGAASKLQSYGWIYVEPKRVFQYPRKEQPSSQDLPPGGFNIQNLALKLPFALTDDSLKRINDGTLSFYVYGISEYYDNTLERSRKRTLFWCTYYDPNKTDKLALIVCPEHNYTTVQP